jgi:acetoin utilization deacetylase AcuC-like enzyme
MQRTLLLSHPLLLQHGHPEHPENFLRLKTILAKIEASPFQELLRLDFNRMATRDELSLIHAPEYVDRILAQKGAFFDVDHETRLTPDSVAAACLAAGLGLELLEQCVAGNLRNGFALVRPPGHHSRPEQGMGFCVFNNIAIAAKRALSLGLQRILILDWDVHHGNGTQDAFYEDNRVLFIDLHQEGLFPNNTGFQNEEGAGKGLGYTVNVPLPHSCTETDYLHVLNTLVRPLAQRFRPELILVSAGFDAHENDPLGSMSISTAGFGNLALATHTLATDLCDGKLLLFLEGGYEPQALSENVLACIRALASHIAPPLTQKELQPGVVELTREIYESHLQKLTE